MGNTKVEAMFKKMTLNNITTLTKVMHCGGITKSELLDVKNSKNNQNNYLMWKKRLENQIKDLCRDLDHVVELSKGNEFKKKHSDQLQIKYFLKQKDFACVME